MLTLTFDDCYLSQKKAQELLRTYDLKGSFYVITDNFNITQDYYMSKDDILNLVKDGHEVGSHTKSHPKLSEITDVKIDEELQGSKKDLSEIGIVASTFVYPYGKYNTNILQKVRDTGYSCSRTTKFGYNDANSDPYQLKCQPVYRWVPFFVIKYWINKAERKNLWLILMFHQIDNKIMKYYGCSPKMCKKIMHYISFKKINTVTMREGIEIIRPHV